jgi:hypothetical protein
MRVEDYFANGKRWWMCLHEKGGKRHEMPPHHKLEAFLDEYICTAGLAGTDQGAVPQADEVEVSMLSISTRAWLVVSTGVLPRLITCLGPRTEVAGFVARILPVTNQSNSIRMAAWCCLIVGFATLGGVAGTGNRRRHHEAAAPVAYCRVCLPGRNRDGLIHAFSVT